MERVACFGIHDEARSLGRRGSGSQGGFHLINRVKGDALVLAAMEERTGANRRKARAAGDQA
jgi:hypothetical protein